MSRRFLLAAAVGVLAVSGATAAPRDPAAPARKAGPGKAAKGARAAKGTQVTKGARVKKDAQVRKDAPAPKLPNLSAQQIVARNVAARGGLEKWRAVSTLSTSGKIDAGGKPNVELPFVMKQKRGHKSRLEIAFHGQTAVQVYDGSQGWKLRPFLNRNEVEPYTASEARSAATWEELDGPLVDHARKGTRVERAGTERIDGHDTYRLKLTSRSGEERLVWIDAKTFLERKIEGEPRKMDAKVRHVAIYYRDFRTEKGLTTPRVLETVADGVPQRHKLTIAQVTVNEPMADTLFGKPQLAALTVPAR